jgi:pimeloyl-ACP methyl ester carboxylesterase
MHRPAQVLFAFLLALAAGAHCAPAVQSVPAACKPGQAIREERFVSIGGIEQWVVIKGSDCRNPVLLIVHGGPGNPVSPFMDAMYAGWERDFTLVTWDQRGAGRTFGRNFVPPETTEQLLSPALLARDGVEVAAWAARRLGKRRVILFGGSWGSALAVHMAKLRPALFAAYVGTGQLVGGRENLAASYARTLGLARAAGHDKTVAELEALGAPPWTEPRAPGILRRATRYYEARATDSAPPAWFERAPRYAGTLDRDHYHNGEDFSWLQYVGTSGGGMAATLDLYRLGVDFGMPVFLVQGSADLVTVPEVARTYFDALKAPRKQFFVLERVGHDPNEAMLATQLDILRRLAGPLGD